MPKQYTTKRSKKSDKRRRTFEKYGKNTAKGLRRKLALAQKAVKAPKNMKASDMKASDMKASDMKASDMKASDMKALPNK
jgi:hypothetical protein